MSFTQIQTDNIDLTTINRQAYPPTGSINITNNTLNSRLLIVAAPSTGVKTSLDTNAKFFYDPALGIIYTGAPDHFITNPTPYSTSTATINAVNIIGGILVNTNGTSTTWTLDTGANLEAYATPNGAGDTFCVYVCNANGVAMTISPPGDSSITVVNTTSPTTSFTMVFRYFGSNTWTCYF